MIKVINTFLFPIVILLSTYFLSINLQALSYGLGIEFEINLLENNSALVTQKVEIKNNSADFLSTSMSLDFPFEKVESLKVSSNGELLPATIENGRLWIEFEDEAIDFGEDRKFDITYEIPNFTKSYGDIRGFEWPKFTVEDQELIYPLKISYPQSWDDVSYSSKGVDMNVVLGTKRAIAFNNVSSPVGVYFGKYTLKQFNIKLLADRLSESETSIKIPFNSNFYFSNVGEATSINNGEGKVSATIDIKDYQLGLPLGIISTNDNEFTSNISQNSYSNGVNEIIGIDSQDPEKLYKILLAKLTPQTEISEWKRNNVSEILKAGKHTDLDYASIYSEIFRSKGIPSQILYGIVMFPDGEYHWHFWLAYLENDSEKGWKQIDPYLEDLTGYEGFSNVTPIRIAWGELNPESDLSDIDVDLFSVSIEDFSVRNFTNSLAQSGFITSRLNDKTFAVDESVLGLNTNNTTVAQKEYHNSLLYILIGFSMILISVLITLREYRLNYKTKIHK